MKKSVSFYVMHICLCFTFLFLPYVFSSTGSIFDLPNLTGNPHDRIYFFIYFFAAAVLLFQLLHFNPEALFQRKTASVCRSFLALFLLFFLWISTVFDTPDRNFLDFRASKPFPSGKIHRPEPMEFKHLNGLFPNKIP